MSYEPDPSEEGEGEPTDKTFGDLEPEDLIDDSDPDSPSESTGGE